MLGVSSQRWFLGVAHAADAATDAGGRCGRMPTRDDARLLHRARSGGIVPNQAAAPHAAMAVSSLWKGSGIRRARGCRSGGHDVRAIREDDITMSETITVAGNLAADPERRTTAGGDAVVSFRVGSTQRRLDKDTGQWVDAYTNWFHVSAFRSLAENALLSLRKGDRVIVTGTLRLRTWENDSRSGVTADIDAAAIGPDLRWGTTVFTRRARGEDRNDSRGESPAPTGAVDAAGWALPPSSDGGAPSAEAAEAAAVRADDEAPAPRPAEGELAWAGAAGGETPF